MEFAPGPEEIVERKKGNDVLIPEWKILIRRGVPCYKLKKVILQIFKKSWKNNEIEYKSALDLKFDGKIPNSLRNAPLFSTGNSLEEIMKLHFLTPKGLLVIKL